MKVTITIALLSTLVLAGCGSSPPNRYYLLTPGATSAAAGQTPSLGVGPVDIAAYLDRAGLVYRLEGNRLHISRTERWAEPLDNGIGRVLTLNLSSLLDTANVRGFPWNAREAPEVGVRVNVLAMEAGATDATLVAEWQVYRPLAGEAGGQHLSRLSRPLGAGTEDAAPAELAAAYSELLLRLSQEIAAEVRQLKL